MEGPFGVDVATACIGSNEMLLYSPWDHLAYQGSIQNNWIFEFIPGDIDSSQYVLGMMGLLIPRLPAQDSLKTYYQKRNRYVLDYGKSGSLWVEAKGPVVTRWEKSDDNGKMCWLWEANRFKRKGKVYVPQQVKWTSYESMQRISLFYEKVKTNRKLKNGWCDISIPEGVDTLAL
jgi:hypothetical protein